MKKLLKLFTIITTMILLTGCLKTETLDNANIYVSIYPIEYITKELYGYNSEIDSIYPDGINIKEYSLSNKKIKKYSNSDLFIYTGLTEEKKITANFITKNKDLIIIDATEDLKINQSIYYSYEEAWLNPNNYLKVAQNINNGLKENINSTIIKEEIDKNYENLKVNISEFVTTLQLLKQNGKYNTLVFSKNYFNFLNKDYGFEIISLEETDELTQDTINRVKKLIRNNDIKYIYVTSEEAKEEKYTDTIEELKNAGAEIKVINTMVNLTEEERNSHENYITLMKENIELIKEEIYKD